MRTVVSSTIDGEQSRNVGRTVGRIGLQCVWQLIRIPLLALLHVLEPIVSLVLSSLALLGVLVACVLEFAANLPYFPFWGMLAASLGCAGLLALYHALMRFLATH